jgi:hypothetical protein
MELFSHLDIILDDMEIIKRISVSPYIRICVSEFGTDGQFMDTDRWFLKVPFIKEDVPIPANIFESFVQLIRTVTATRADDIQKAINLECNDVEKTYKHRLQTAAEEKKNQMHYLEGRYNKLCKLVPSIAKKTSPEDQCTFERIMSAEQ